MPQILQTKGSVLAPAKFAKGPAAAAVAAATVVVVVAAAVAALALVSLTSTSTSWILACRLSKAALSKV